MPPASPDPRAARETRSPRDTWDVVVIGGGPAGENAADYAIRGSDRTAVIVENELLGGECSYWACIPSKTLLRSVELFTEAESLQGTATRLSTKGIDVKAVLGRRDEFTSHLDDAGPGEMGQGRGHRCPSRATVASPGPEPCRWPTPTDRRETSPPGTR